MWSSQKMYVITSYSIHYTKLYDKGIWFERRKNKLFWVHLFHIFWLSSYGRFMLLVINWFLLRLPPNLELSALLTPSAPSTFCTMHFLCTSHSLCTTHYSLRTPNFLYTSHQIFFVSYFLPHLCSSWKIIMVWWLLIKREDYRCWVCLIIAVKMG